MSNPGIPLSVDETVPETAAIGELKLGYLKFTSSHLTDSPQHTKQDLTTSGKFGIKRGKKRTLDDPEKGGRRGEGRVNLVKRKRLEITSPTTRSVKRRQNFEAALEDMRRQTREQIKKSKEARNRSHTNSFHDDEDPDEDILASHPQHEPLSSVAGATRYIPQDPRRRAQRSPSQQPQPQPPQYQTAIYQSPYSSSSPYHQTTTQTPTSILTYGSPAVSTLSTSYSQSPYQQSYTAQSSHTGFYPYKYPNQPDPPYLSAYPPLSRPPNTPTTSEFPHRQQQGLIPGSRGPGRSYAEHADESQRRINAHEVEEDDDAEEEEYRSSSRQQQYDELRRNARRRLKR